MVAFNGRPYGGKLLGYGTHGDSWSHALRA